MGNLSFDHSSKLGRRKFLIKISTEDSEVDLDLIYQYFEKEFLPPGQLDMNKLRVSHEYINSVFKEFSRNSATSHDLRKKMDQDANRLISSGAYDLKLGLKQFVYLITLLNLGVLIYLTLILILLLNEPATNGLQGLGVIYCLAGLVLVGFPAFGQYKATRKSLNALLVVCSFCLFLLYSLVAVSYSTLLYPLCIAEAIIFAWVAIRSRPI